NSTIYNTLINTGASGSQLSFTFSPTQGGPAFPQILASAPTDTVKTNVVFFDHNFQNPQIYEADLSLQHEFAWGMVASLNYLGSFGHELPNFVDTNLPGTPTTITYTVVDPTGKGPIKSPTLTSLL